MIPSRPLTFCDQRAFTHNRFDELKSPQDKWGRSAAFCSVYSSSDDIQERTHDYGDDQQIDISRRCKDKDYMNIGGGKHDCSGELLEQFLNSHYTKNDDNMSTRYSNKVPSDHFIANFENHGARIESNLL